MRRIALNCLALVSLALACGDGTVTTVDPPAAVHRPDAIGLDRESEEAALWLSGKLTAPLPLYETIADDLAAIRAEYGDVIPLDFESGTPIQFYPWWLVSQIEVHVTTALRDAVLAHAPNPLDSLNAGYHAAGMSPFSFRQSQYGWSTTVFFAGRQHPVRLSQVYDAAPGVNLAFAQHWRGDASNVYPWHIPGGMSYLFHNAFGDCPAGCIENHFYYFRRVGDTTEFVGWFRIYWDPYPTWWPEASDAFCAFGMEQKGWPYCPWAVTPDPQAKSATPTVSGVP
jgi:hypothetical protein